MMGPRSSQRRRTGNKPFFAAAALALALVLPGSAHAATQKCTDPAAESIVKSLAPLAPKLSAEVLRLAVNASKCAEKQGYVKRNDLLTVIDYSRPSREPRLFVFNVRERRLLFQELVAHGKNSGNDLTTFFSNDEGSRATSMGLFVTADTYNGSNGYSLRLRGLDRGFNDRAHERAIVMHGASYVSDTIVRSLGRLGRSWGCPAVRKEIAKKMIDTIKGGTPIFAYYPDKTWLASSIFLR